MSVGTLFSTALIVTVCVGLAWGLGGWLGSMTEMMLERSGSDASVRRLVASAVRIGVLVLTVLAVASWLGLDLTAVVAVLAAATLAVGIALGSTLSNLASGSILLTLRPFREGESVRIGPHVGVVQALGLYATVLRTAQGETVTLPNDTVLDGAIVNQCRHGSRRIDLSVVIAYDADVAGATAAMLQVLQAHAAILEAPPAAVHVGALDGRGVELVGQAWVPAAAYVTVRSELATAVLEALREGGIAWPAAPIAVEV